MKIPHIIRNNTGLINLGYNTSMNRRIVRSLIAITVLTVTAVAAIRYLRLNPDVIDRLLSTPFETVLLLTGLYLFFMISLWMIFRSSLTLCGASLPRAETMLVTAYSSIINFFGPLQSGPAFRAVYLKKRHHISLRKYALASLVYYFFYALYSGLFLLSGVVGWGVIPLAFLGLAAIYFVSKLPIESVRQISRLNRRGFLQTAAATALQVSIFAVIFYIELNTYYPAVTVQQALTYTGAANFALFVSITPGAIGFRESFVLLTEKIHQIPEAAVVAASLLDRGVYVMMLLLLGLFIFGTHARSAIRRISQQ